MKILIAGAGLSGCAIARMAKDVGHDIHIIEKENELGGLCVTRRDCYGLKYEPYGARTFHTHKEHIQKFVCRFDDFNGYIHRKGMILNGTVFPFPMTRSTVERLPERDIILRELANRPDQVDTTNFETACVSIFGKTLYNYFIRNYSAKMWGCHPSALTAEWAPKRLEFRDDGCDELFRGQWQGLPEQGYSVWQENMIHGIPIRLNATDYNPKQYDLVLSSAPIDELVGYRFGRLEYRSMHFEYQRDEPWEKDTYGTINLPEENTLFLRKCNFKVLHRQISDHNYIQYQQAISTDDQHMPMYPVSTNKNLKIFHSCLAFCCEQGKICPVGRLGLFKYLDMDKAVEVAFNLFPGVLEYPRMTPAERVKFLSAARDNI